MSVSTFSFDHRCLATAQGRAIVAQRTRSTMVLAMRLRHTADAQGKPFLVHVARCARYPQGLGIAMMQNSQVQQPRYCRETLRATGNM